MRSPAVLNWSGGKDATLSLYELQQTNSPYEVVQLLTTVGEEQRRITMHGVHETLVELQAAALGLPLVRLYLPKEVDMPTYSQLMEEQCARLQAQGIRHSVFGDIHLEDLKAYRETALAKAGLQGVFPLWQQSVQTVAKRFIDLGFKAIVVCVNARVLDRSFVGRPYDTQFLADLPEGVDVCGENGEFHTFVYDGPIFQQPVPIRLGEVVHRHYASEDTSANHDTGFYFQELLEQ